MVYLIWVGIGILLTHGHPGTQLLPRIVLQSRNNDKRFVFADLDGDRKPDLALVETQSGRAANTSYSIHIKLSAGAESAIGLNGPIGGALWPICRGTARKIVRLSRNGLPKVLWPIGGFKPQGVTIVSEPMAA